MPCEHIQKEKEYGITWRTAFKLELNAFIEILAKKLVSTGGFAEQDPFEVLHKIVKKDCIDVATFDMRTQSDLMAMMVDNLELLEKTIWMIKVLLKEPETEHFAHKKEEALMRLKLEHGH